MNRSYRLVGWTCLTAFLFFSSAGAFGAPEGGRPNIVFIMSDDHATSAISAYGSKINRTPNLDRLADQGMRFENAFCTNSICAPSRAVILTGKYSHLNGVRDNRAAFNGKQVTFPKLLRQAGYQTTIVGKWHLKSLPTGFDYSNVLPGQGAYHNPALIEQGQTKKHTGYATDIITNLAIEWLGRRDRRKPFCLLVQHKAPHANWETDTKHAQMYADMKIPEPATFNDDGRGRSSAMREHQLRIGPSQWRLHYRRRFGPIPNDVPNEKVRGWVYQRYIKDYLRCVASIDDNVGRLLDHLDKTGLTQNTIVVYTSDQGFFLGEHGLYDKRFMYEPSLRMPLLVRYPKRIKAGSTTDAIALNLDFAATFLDYAGVKIPAGMQGHSLRRVLRGERPKDWRSVMYYRFYEKGYDIGPMEGVRTQRYKLIHYLYADQAWELYDLQNDPDEMRNLYSDAKHADLVERLKAQIGRLRTQYRFNTSD